MRYTLDQQERQFIVELQRQGGCAVIPLLMCQLRWHEQLFWSVQDRLLHKRILCHSDDGSDSLWLAHEPATMHACVADVLRADWSLDRGYRASVVEIGSSDTTGLIGARSEYSDITVVGIRNKWQLTDRFDIVTFEVRMGVPEDASVIEQALLHRRAATKSFVWLHVPDRDGTSESSLTAFAEVARQHGIGLMAASSPTDYKAWRTLAPAQRVQPKADSLSRFLALRMAPPDKEQLQSARVDR